MYPSLLAEEIKSAVTEYLSTTFALADDDERAALEFFLLDRDTGIFRGPYLRVRTPFHKVDDRSWRSPLDWMPRDFLPYVHQATAFERLSTRDGAAQPTIVTTGTGSGKTESFLIPLLDHAARAKASGERGIKAVILYPMNALVTDQARRLAELLHDEPALEAVTAGVYIGSGGKRTKSSREHLIDSRDALRADPPDILLTNYKMLDLLLLRAADAPLWSASTTSLRYLVLDEFHTYDGAQGTDVAMLLRRLGATLKVAEANRPLGRITPVATSATLGGSARSAELRAFAETVFGTPFPPEAVISEKRLEAADVVPDVDFELPVPDVRAVAGLERPTAEKKGSWQALAHGFLSGVIGDELMLGRKLSRSFILRAVVQALSAGPLTVGEAVDAVASSGVLQWGVAQQRTPELVEQALLRFLALVSTARTEAGKRRRPLLNLEVQLWVRELTRMLRAVDGSPRFTWWHDGRNDGELLYLPAAYCRVCGRSGWQTTALELDETFETSAERIWRTSVMERAKSRTLLPAGENELNARRIDPRTLAYCTEDQDGLWVLVTPDGDAARAQRCPACKSDDAIRFLGSSVATLVSVALTSLFGSPLVDDGEKKTLVFTDSVQDAAHRAAFIEGRAFQFNLRSAVLRAVGDEPRSLADVTRRLGDSSIPDLYALTPSDFARRLGYRDEWLDHDPGRKRRSLLRTRLTFQTQLELGLRSRLGRTLELTGALGVSYDLDLEHYAALARSEHESLPEAPGIYPSQERYQIWILGLLDRLRRRGGIYHREWLSGYLSQDGRRWRISGGAPQGMQRFPFRGAAVPTFFTTGTKGDFDSLRARSETWLANWTQRALGVTAGEARLLLERVVHQLSEGDAALLKRYKTESDATVYALDPARIVLHPLGDEELEAAQLRCTDCQHIQPSAPHDFALWRQAPCPVHRCEGRLEPHPVRSENFYRDLYRSGRLRHLVTHEHTALLDDETRLRVERAFASGDSPIDPNVLTCTPTLELGIDIGDLSTVGLASLPRSPANYLQRVGRAGRSTGNALVLATVPSSPRDLYYLSEPKFLIDGEVIPPAAYLAATELLYRQYLAFCLDRVADGEIGLNRDMPHRLGLLLEKGLASGTWLRQFVDTVTERANELAPRFLSLYTGALDRPARDAVISFAADGLRRAVARVASEWAEQRQEMQRRKVELAQSIADLKKQGHLDDTQQEDLRRWRGESQALEGMLRGYAAREVLTGLGELSLLPSYNLLDDHTELDVSLWWTTDDEGSSGLQTSEHTYQRGSRTALTEFAPGAVFYARGYRVEIDAVEIGPVSRPHWRYLRLCPECGWGTERVDPAPGECPRCRRSGVGDSGAVHKVLELRRVSAVHRRDEAIIEDEADERTRTTFHTVTGVDVEPTHIVSAWRLREKVFGAEYVTKAEIRTVNVGPRGKPGAETTIAGARLAAPRFPACAYCGVVRRERDEDRVRHRGWCSTRRGTPVQWEDLLLSHEISTQAVRILLPVSTFHVETRLASFKTALLLGLRHDFGGDPQHLDVVTARMPDEHGRTRLFLVLHDTVPGGTGYLDRLGEPDRMRSILQQAYDALLICDCQQDGRVACHRCLLGVASSAEVEYANRRVAVELLTELLSNWDFEDISTVADIDISSVQLSELELRFREQLKRAVRAEPDQSWAGSIGNRGEELDIRLAGPDGTPRRWTVRPLETVKVGGVATEPDFLFARQDTQDAPVAVYLDGKRYHASAENSGTAEDARKRAALRADGWRVWSLTWQDVEDFARTLDKYDSKLPELVDGSVRNAVRAEVSDHRVNAVWGNPMAALIEYLKDPAAAVWGDTALQTCLALMRTPRHRAGPPLGCQPTRLSAVLDAWAGGGSTVGGSGPVVFAPCRGMSGLPIAVIGHIDRRPQECLGVATVLDDRPSEVGGPVHDEHWRDWLRWGNVLQFVKHPVYGQEMPLRMTECWTRESLDEFRSRIPPLAIAERGAAAQPATAAYPEAWNLVIELTDKSLATLGPKLGSRGAPAPEPGGEVGDEMWPLEYCWEDELVGLVVDKNEERDAWLGRNGWRIFRYSDYSAEDDLVEAIMAALQAVAE